MKTRRVHRNRSYNRDSSNAKTRKWMTHNRALLTAYLWFGATLLGLFTVLMLSSTYHGVVMPFNNFLAWSTAGVLTLLGGGPLTVNGTSVSGTTFGFSVAEGCNGIYALVIVIAGVMALPIRWSRKVVGLILAAVYIMALNYIRLLTLWYFGQTSPLLFDTMHLYVWEFIIIALGAAFCYWWYEKSARSR